MAEYIEREKLYNNLIRLAKYETGERQQGILGAAETVRLFSAADVAPVVHGRWIIGVDDDDFDVKCSKCEWTDIFEVAGIAAVERIAKAMHYCLNCGARMDGGDNDATD